MLAMFGYGFMVNALLAGGVVAATSALVGFMLVLRGQSFAGHALSHVGFTGATGAVLLGLPPLGGLVGASLLAGLLMGLLGERTARRDVAIGLVLATALGLGLLFLHFFTAYASQATALLFGNIFGIDRQTFWMLLLVCLCSAGGLALIGRPLLFASLHPELAEARGVSPRLFGTLFLLVVGLATAGCAQVVGVLLVFSLMVGPAAAALRVCATPRRALCVAVLFGVAQAWGGIVLAWFTDWPASFWITSLSAATFLLSCLPWRRWRASRPADLLPAR
ncbi:metal ABC transporter permease [Rhizosaccharibacter radicis]|uniref:Metal ABC transporter permease n=1 Tax=Rhizosaccharibacter radicis TaxID=2782605 RepID=A0ABT1VTD3_9PROT|nr:metal ABC transporter permease [Acetobacteraceae bacterium KSS12]